MRAFNLTSQNQENIDPNTNNMVEPHVQDYSNQFNHLNVHYGDITP